MRQHVRFILGIFMATVPLAGCGSMEKAQDGEAKAYTVHRAPSEMKIDAKWEKPAWRDTQAIVLTNYMGERPSHFPKTQAKIAYDDAALYVIFHVDDRYVRAVAKEHQGPVCKDSCVEFFFSPSGDVGDGYMNMEMNCGGTMLFHYQMLPSKNQKPVSEADLEAVQVAHILPRIVEPELTEPTAWTVEYRIPFELIAKYAPNARQPAPGVTWRANVYKCADHSSHPHWLTWSPVTWKQPNFHLPQYFGTLRFD